MNIEQNTSFDFLFKEIDILCFCLNDSLKVLSYNGNLNLLGLKSVCDDIHLPNLLPDSIKSEVLTSIENYKLYQNPIKKEVSYINKRAIPISLNFSIHSYNTSLYVSFTKNYSVKSHINESSGFESYQDALNKLEFSEKRYHSFFENDPVMHLSVNPHTGLIVECNQFGVHKLGYKYKEEVVGKPIYTIFTEDRKAKCLALVDKFKAQGFLAKEEMDLKTKLGKIIPVLLYTTAQRDENGNILFSRSTLVDISELKEAENKLEKKKSYLELLNNQLEHFVSSCSHDLKEPLGTIKLSADVLGKLYGSQLDEKANNYIRYINETVDRMNSQISMLLTHAKMGNMDDKSMVNLNSILNAVIQDLGATIKNAKAQVNIPKDLPHILAFETELRLLFQNLISNAVKYCNPNIPPIVDISFNQTETNYCFTVMDNGIGISKSNQAEIFKIFNTVNDDNPNKGSGIGLSHCEKIVQLHEGSIRVESTVGKGSAFIFTLKK